MRTEYAAPTESARLAARERPEGLPVMFQGWKDLLFLHWKLEPEAVQSTLPRGLQVDTYNGSAYVGLIPFRVTGLRPPFLPPLPIVSEFLELNIRTYVYDHRGRPGIWFYSLYANQPLAVVGARLSYHLPYRFARMSVRSDTEGFDYKVTSGGNSASFHYTLSRSLGPAEPSTLEYFLIERYILFSVPAGAKKLFCARVHHRPYPLFSTQATQNGNEILRSNGLEFGNRPPDHVIASAGVDTQVYPLEKIS